ncbi:gene transfer agent family protein [Ancylobacter sp. A5.8]|uniref:gene transfer agent family protein n=1 Tax=Ancylobacter gelatini TaxID=2919920 RepID=UPI001F4D39C6|nr:gene transfer agent family protein [Ancylobacter gelatini]MCJ8143867.1 gene transfer agent family protein [Ancylobacter gelatini]
MAQAPVNRHRGEIAAELDGRPRRLVLTLGALAELEGALGASDLMALAERFSRGRLSARDAVAILAAGLRGAGESVSDEEVARMTTPGGAAGYARLVGELIAATFGGAPDRGRPGEDPPDPPVPQAG